MFIFFLISFISLIFTNFSGVHSASDNGIYLQTVIDLAKCAHIYTQQSVSGSLGVLFL